MSFNAAIRTEEDLRHWLEMEDWYLSRHTQEWLDRTPPSEAAEVLANIAEDADREPRGSWSGVAMAIATAGFSPSGAIAGKGPAKRKAGTRAALILADMGDLRSVPALARTFDRQGKYQSLIESALLRILPAAEAEATGAAAKYAPAVLDLAERIREMSGRDLSPAHADLLIASLRFLNAAGSAPGRALLRTLAEAPPPPNGRPGRALVREAAREMLRLAS
jgi:hypothetical protein